jgi:HPt (histidine-containing phosphotransfer) domain-containing protein
MTRNPTADRTIAARGPIQEHVLSQVRSDFDDADGSIVAALVAAFTESADIFELASVLPEDLEHSTLEQRAQRLRGAAVMVGAQHVATLCHHIEAAARCADRPCTDELVQQLLAAIRVANAALSRALSVDPSIPAAAQPGR